MHTNMLIALPRTKTYFFPCAQRRAGRRKRARRRFASFLFLLPHALRHQSLAFRAHLTFVWRTKHWPEEEAEDPCMKEQFLWKSLRKQDIQSIYNTCHIIEHFICFIGEARVAQWWEHSPPTIVAQIAILASTPYGGWVCCWSSPLRRDIFFRVLRFPPLHPPRPLSSKNQHLANSNSIWSARTRFKEFLRTPKCSVGKQITNYNFLKLFWPCTLWNNDHT